MDRALEFYKSGDFTPSWKFGSSFREAGDLRPMNVDLPPQPNIACAAFPY